LRDRTVTAQYVIGCDGASSTVRGALGIEYEDLEFDQPWLVVDLLVSPKGIEKLPKVSIQYCEPERPTTYLVGVGAHRRWELMLNENEEPDAWKLLSRWITPDDAQLWRAASYRFHALVAQEWRRGRVFLAGDAAHQQPPFTGQGMCQGIRDAANLSWKLHYVLAGKAKEKLLDTYEVERRAHAKRLIRVVKDIGAVICERNVEKARARDRYHLAQAGGEIPTVPRQHLIPPLEGGLLSSHAHPANGTLFPKDGGSGLRTVRRDGAEGVVGDWFIRNTCSAAIVRPDHYVYGVAHDEKALDRLQKEVAKHLR
jgi:3-(3-hydroxy-phenyl)propionate hydroxylase